MLACPPAAWHEPLQAVRIAIVTSRRFHMLDLARELEAVGHDVSLYSSLHASKVARAGVSPESFRSVRRACLPWLFAAHLGTPRMREDAEPRLHRAVDRAAARRLARCDVLIGLSGTSMKCFQKAKGRHEAHLYLERGGRHILSQKDILEQIPQMPHPAVPHTELKREIWGYNHADVVVVASRHAEESFLERGVDSKRIFRTPYGVDLDKFGPSARLPREIPTVLYVGTWSYKNGCDVLGHALRGQHVKLIHIGPRGDAPTPPIENFERRDMVEDWDLCQIFRGVDILARPSRGEGMDMVLAQALASGLPVVCTDRSGGEDLRKYIEEPDAVFIAKAGNLETLAEALQKALAFAFTQKGPRSFLTTGRDELSWKSYGQRYHRDLTQRLEAKTVVVEATVPIAVPIPEPGA